MSVPPKPGLGLPLVGIAPPDAPDAPPFAPDAPPGPPGAPPGPPGGPALSVAQAKVDSILSSNTDRETIIKALEKEIDEAILASIIESDDEAEPSIFQGCELLYEPKVVSGYALIDPETREFVKNQRKSAIEKDIRELREELQKIETDIQSSRKYQNYIRELEEKKASLTGNISSNRTLLSNNKVNDDDKKLVRERIKTFTEELHSHDAELKSLALSPTPSFRLLVSMEVFRLKKLEKRLTMLENPETASAKTTLSSEQITDSRSARKLKLAKDLKIYSEEWATQKMTLMSESPDITPADVVNELSDSQDLYIKRLKKESVDTTKNLIELTENVEGLFGSIQNECKLISEQVAFNQEAELTKEEGELILAKQTESISGHLSSIERLADEAIKIDSLTQVKDVRAKAASIKARAIQTAATVLGSTRKKKEKVVVRVDAVREGAELITQASQESKPIIFDFGPTTLYTKKELATLTRHFGYSLDVSVIAKNLEGEFVPFSKDPTKPEISKLHTWELEHHRNGVKGMKNANGAYQPRECIQTVLGIADINFELERRKAEIGNKAREEAERLRAEAKTSAEPSADGDEPAVRIVMSSDGGGGVEPKSDDLADSPALRRMMASAADLEAVSARLAETERKYQEERRAREAAELKNSAISAILKVDGSQQSPEALAKAVAKAVLGEEGAAKVEAQEKAKVTARRMR